MKCSEGKPPAGPAGGSALSPRFAAMVENCLAYCEVQQEAGRPIVGIFCEYTPRELILAAGGVPVCMCGGAEEMIAPAEADLPAGLCPLIKSSYGYHKEQANPFLEMASLLVAETTCDGKKKMYELLARERRLHLLELTQKSDDEPAFAHWRQEVVRFRERLEAEFGVPITQEGLRQAVRTMNEERAARLALADYAKPPTVITGLEYLELRSLVAGCPCDLAAWREAAQLLAARRFAGAGLEGPRLLVTGVPSPHGAEKVVRIAEEAGGVVVAQETCTGIKPHLLPVEEAADDLVGAIAWKYYQLPCSCMTPNQRRLEQISRLIREYQVEAVIDHVWTSCLTYDVESRQVADWVRDQHGLPYLKLECGYGEADEARVRLRLEALLETVEKRLQG